MKKKIYQSNYCAPFKIVEDLGRRNSRLYVKIKFIETGAEKEISNNLYQVSFSIDGNKISFGTYSNILVAANAYNYYYKLYSKAELVQLLNENIEYMSFEEIQKYLISTNIK